MGSGSGAEENGGTRGVCAVPGEAGYAHKDCCDHSLWSDREIQKASGLPQGGTHSSALWNGFIDIMAEMQHEMAREKGVRVEDEWGKEWELLTQLFADDAHHCASGTNCVKGLGEVRDCDLVGCFLRYGAQSDQVQCSGGQMEQG